MRFFLIFFWGMLCSVLVKAEQPHIISYYHRDTPIDLHRLDHFNFRPMGEMGDKGYYLFKLTLQGTLPADGLLLFIENEHLDTVALYQPHADSLVHLSYAGNSFPETTQRFGLAQFRLNGNERTYYLLTHFDGDVSFDLKIDSATNMNRWSMAVFFQLGIYYGLSLMFFLINLFLFLYLRDRVFLHYCLFQFFVVGTIAYADGLFAFVFSGRWLLNHADILLHIGLAVSGALFSLEFLGKFGNKLLRRLTCLTLGLIVLTYAMSMAMQSHVLFLMGEGLVLLLLCAFWIIAAGQFKKQVHARFFVLGYGVFFLFALDYFLLRKLDIYVLDFYMGQLKTGSFIEMLVLSAAIVFRVNSLRIENESFRLAIEQSMKKIAAYELQETTHQQELFEKVQQKYNLSDRETEVLRGIVEGLTNTQIAEKIFLSVHTVKFHTRNIFDKLDITNRAQASGKLRV